ncbi:MAG: hypothetical protein U0746_10620 [Gemmataceae bacterium]
MLKPRVVGPEQNFQGCDYSDEEREFLMAMERYRRREHRPFPTCREVLYVLLSLGYRKPPAAEGPRTKDQEPRDEGNA